MPLTYVESTTTLFKWLAILLISSGLWIGAGVIKDASLFGPSKTELSATVASQAATIKALQEAVARLESSQKLQTELNDTVVEVIAKTEVEQKAIEKNLDQKITKVQKTVKDIQSNTAYTDVEKDVETSSALFDAMEDARCSHITQQCFKEST